MRIKRPLPDRRRGLRVVGPGFYLWDPDEREALGLAAELRRRLAPPAPRLPRSRSLPPEPLG
jgi:hypothetical protein